MVGPRRRGFSPVSRPTARSSELAEALGRLQTVDSEAVECLLDAASARSPMSGVNIGNVVRRSAPQTGWRMGCMALQWALDKNLNDVSACAHVAVTLCGQASHWRVALQLFRKVPPVSRDTTLYESVLWSVVAGASIHSASRLLDLQQREGPPATEAAVKALALTCAEGVLEWGADEAVPFLKRSLHWGVECVTPVVDAIAVTALSRSWHWAEALGVVDKALRSNRSGALAEERFGDAALWAMERAKAWEAALGLFSSLPRPSAGGYSAVVTVCAAEEPATALEVFMKMRERYLVSIAAW
eukprot:Hpha_TRINITY_DN27530_c0_g1::TRINITY_DN27530_c0_g1_i1::g.86193::m.86193